MVTMRVRRQESVHPPADVAAPRRAHNEMEVIRHQAGREHLESHDSLDGDQKVEEYGVIPMIKKNRRAVIATVDDVVTTSRDDGPPASWHAAS
jgi:hypothetical protein